ncbi:MAG: phosphate ABC transporter permease subunit PstC [Actinobacteria bacterium]|nr:phosphate ABC transporter permease subunit PstC [Actinomycetota bacterium]
MEKSKSIGGEWIARKTLSVLAMMMVLAIVLIIMMVAKESMPALTKVGPFNLFSTTWEPKTGNYGITVFIVGTVLTTLGGLLVAVPLALGTAVFLTQMAPKRVGMLVTRGVEILAGIPSIVIGWLGFTLLVPLLATITRTTGTGILAASIILGIMSMPTITSIARDALDTVPPSYKQASIGLGATRWQTIRHVILPAARPGLLVAVILGMGRAIGETVAVAMVIGPASVFPKSLTTPTHTLTTKILMEMGESSGLQRSVIFFMAFVLLLVSMMMILGVRLAARRKVYSK